MRKEIKIEGLENINAIEEGTEGTVFRGRRVKEIDTIIKVLPYPVNQRKKEEPGTVIYLREAKRLKHLNQVPNMYVVKIINIGLTEKEMFPFIESELVKGPDLDELVTFPNHPIFKLEEVVNLLTQMADALAHCHSAMVRHGRINSNNIRLNSETGMYTLLNFGRTLLTDEQNKQEIENARAPEYLAPEQLGGGLMFESDIYSLGVLLFQLLTGAFPQKTVSAGDGAAPVSSIGQQIKERRRENLPFSWTDVEKVQEMNIPVWLSNIVAICLQQDPAKRYSNGIKLHEAVKQSSAKVIESAVSNGAAGSVKKPENKEIISPLPVTAENKPTVAVPVPVPVKEALPTTKGAATVAGKEPIPSNNGAIREPVKEASPVAAVATPKGPAEDAKEAEIKRLKAMLIQKDGQLNVYKYQTADYNPEVNKLSISKPVLLILLGLIALLAAFAAYAYFFRKPETKALITTYTDSDTSSASKDNSQSYISDSYSDSTSNIDTAALIKSLPPIPEEEKTAGKPEKTETKRTETPVKKTAVRKPEKKAVSRTAGIKQTNSVSTTSKEPEKLKEYQNSGNYEPKTKAAKNTKYTLAVSKAYFYDEPDVRSRRPVYLSNTNESEFVATKDSNGFIYVVFFNTDRQITRGWLRKQDLRPIN
jgi:serine/threonine protein kinase